VYSPLPPSLVTFEAFPRRLILPRGFTDATAILQPLETFLGPKTHQFFVFSVSRSFMNLFILRNPVFGPLQCYSTGLWFDFQAWCRPEVSPVRFVGLVLLCPLIPLPDFFPPPVRLFLKSSFLRPTGEPVAFQATFCSSPSPPGLLFYLNPPIQPWASWTCCLGCKSRIFFLRSIIYRSLGHGFGGEPFNFPLQYQAT